MTVFENDRGGWSGIPEGLIKCAALFFSEVLLTLIILRKEHACGVIILKAVPCRVELERIIESLKWQGIH